VYALTTVVDGIAERPAPDNLILDGASPERRRLLLANGYEPIPVCGKAPKWRWREGGITPEKLSEIEAAYPDHTNTGLRTGRLAVVDIDLRDPEHAEVVAEDVQSVLGLTPAERVGRKGMALFFYNPNPIGKITVSGRTPGDGCSERLVEFLGEGQQVASYGIHPDSGLPYEWPNAESGGDPLGTRLENLPQVSEDMLREAASAASRKIKELGYTDVEISESGVSRGEEGASSKEGPPVTTATLEDMLRHIEPTCDRNTWIAMAGAIKSANVIDLETGEADEDFDGLDLFTRWSSGALHGPEMEKSMAALTRNDREVYAGPHDCEMAWNSVTANKVGGATVGSIVFHARKGGYVGPTCVSAIELHRSDLLPDQPNGESLPDFARNQKTGEPFKNFPNALVAAHRMKATPELNEFNHRVIFRGELPWSEKYGRVLDDDLLRTIRVHFLSRFELDARREDVSEAVLTVATSNRFHPVKEYLDSLEWDGKERLDTWLSEFLGVEDTAYTRAVGRKTLIGAVARVLEPGCKFDTVLVLQGVQGVGKSTAVRVLAGDDWFSDSLPGDLSKADAVQAIQGKWIIELSELEGLNRSKVVTIKAFVSRPVDHARFAYDKHAKDYPRQCIFVATTNEKAFLRDSTGARRFWPVQVTEIDLDGLKAARDQLWAEARHRYCEGESLVLPPELWADAARQQEERHAPDPWEDILRVYLAGEASRGFGFTEGPCEPTEPKNRVHSSELLENALRLPKGQQSRNDTSRLRDVMGSRLGWKYKPSLRIETRVSSGYLRPDTGDED